MSNSYDAIILGAGISGLLVAKELQQCGMKVCVLEKSQAGRESSWAGGGIISPLYPWRYPDPVNQLAKWSQTLYPQLVAELEPYLDPEYLLSGMLVLDEQEAPAAKKWAEKYGARIEQLNAADIPLRFPHLQHRGGGLWMPDIAQIRNPRLVKSLLAFLQSRIRLIEDVEGEILIEDGRVCGVQIRHERLLAARVILCAGAWTGSVLQQYGISLDIQPIRGQMLLYQATGLLQSMVLQGHRYLIPRKDGHLLVGSTLEDVGFDKQTTEEAAQELQKFLQDLLPAMRERKILAHWSGLRPASPQGIPFIGKIHKIKGLFVNAGHFRNGVVLGPASAKLLAQIILGQSGPLDPVLFSRESFKN